MPRELSPELFLKRREYDQGRGSQQVSHPENATGESLTPLGARPDYNLPDADFISRPSSDEDFRRQVNYQLELIRRKQRDTDVRVEEVARAVKQNQEVLRQRAEQIQQLQRQIEKFVNGKLQILTSKFSVRLGRIHEKLAGEGKVQELIDRHNQIVQKFELRLNQLQKLMGEQDLKLLSYSDTLKEIRRHLPPKF